MRKKWLTLGSVVGISGIMMVTTGISAMAGTSGYDAYKAALKNTKALQSLSVQAQAELQDNGNTLTNAKGSLKLNLANHTASGAMTVSGNDTGQSVSFFKQNDSTVLKSGSSDVYYVKQNNKKWGSSKKQDKPDLSQEAETVIDALVGNLKDYVALDSNPDGSKTVSVELTSDQLPAAVNAIAPIVIKEATKEHKRDSENKDGKKDVPVNDHAFLADAPHLTQDIKIEKVAIKADIDESNYIRHQQADITVSGKDAGGSSHEVTLHLNADLSGYNSTTPDTVDLTGKQVQQMKQGHKEKHEQNKE